MQCELHSPTFCRTALADSALAAAARSLENKVQDLTIFADGCASSRFSSTDQQLSKFTPAGGRITLESAAREIGPHLWSPRPDRHSHRRSGSGLPGISPGRRDDTGSAGRNWPGAGDHQEVGGAAGRQDLARKRTRKGKLLQLHSADRAATVSVRTTAVPVAGSATARRRNPLVLIVDDEAAARELIASHLEAGHYVVDMACSGKEAVEKARRIRPDVITLDLHAERQRLADFVSVAKHPGAGPHSRDYDSWSMKSRWAWPWARPDIW